MNRKNFLRNCLMAAAISVLPIICMAQKKSNVFYIPAIKDFKEVKVDSAGLIVYTTKNKKCWIRFAAPNKKEWVELKTGKSKVIIDTSEIASRGWVKITLAN